MEFGHWSMLAALILISVIDCGSLVSSACVYTDDTCEFSLVVENTLTMMKDLDLLYPWGGKIYRYNETAPATANSIPWEGIVTADGYEIPRVVTVANGSMPGPPLIVYEGQTVVVNVINRLSTDGVTIHWHGLPQRDTPWMDGVAYITQCPIMPGQSFRYEFKATPSGTFWYHSHIGPQRSNGLFGAFVIRPRKPLTIPEHILTIQDWNHYGDAALNEMKQYHGDYDNRNPITFSKSIDGSLFGRLSFHSGLINGRGRYHDPNIGVHNGAPLSVFDVEAGKVYRFRIINAGMVYPFRFSIDNHNLIVIASDGYDIEHLNVDALIVYPGERYDVMLTTLNVTENYWIRARTLEADFNHRTEAILRYNGAPRDMDPITTEKKCSGTCPCRVLNCPSSKMPPKLHMDCLTFNNIKSTQANSISSQVHGSSAGSFSNKTHLSNSNQTSDVQLKEVFLNFAFPGTSWRPGSVNGKRFEFPDVSALTQMDEINPRQLCENADCGPDKVCSCMHSLTLDHDDVVQMVFLDMGRGRGFGHPIHMHGHSFQVLKTGFGVHDENGQVSADNPDITCLGQKFGNDTFCNTAKWTNSSWTNGNIPGLELQQPPIKDTIIVPTGGYVVVRIRADNPGLWIMHCHVELHTIYGMAMVINESFSNVPKPPHGFPECRSFPPSVVTSGIRNKRSASYAIPDIDNSHGNKPGALADVVDRQTYVWTVMVFGGITLAQAFILILVCRRTKLKTDRKST